MSAPDLDALKSVLVEALWKSMMSDAFGDIGYEAARKMISVSYDLEVTSEHKSVISFPATIYWEEAEQHPVEIDADKLAQTIHSTVAAPLLAQNAALLAALKRTTTTADEPGEIEKLVADQVFHIFYGGPLAGAKGRIASAIVETHVAPLLARIAELEAAVEKWQEEAADLAVVVAPYLEPRLKPARGDL